jgi:hypothetical protein
VKGSKFHMRKRTIGTTYFCDEIGFKNRFLLIEEGDIVTWKPFGQYIWSREGMNSFTPIITKTKFNPEYWGQREVRFCEQIIHKMRSLKFDGGPHSSFCYSKKKIKIGKRKYQVRIIVSSQPQLRFNDPGLFIHTSTHFKAENGVLTTI